MHLSIGVLAGGGGGGRVGGLGIVLRVVVGFLGVEGYRAMNEKIDNGLRLFGRYMRKLWD